MPEAVDMRSRLRNMIEEIVDAKLSSQPQEGVGKTLASIEQRLDALESKKEPSIKEDLSVAIKELRSKRDELQELHDRIDSLESSLRKELDDHIAKVDSLEQNIDEMVKRKEEEFTQLISRGDPAVNKKFNDQFLNWLAGMEKEVKKRTESQNLDDVHDRLDHIEKNAVTHQELQDLEEHLLSPIEKLQGKIDDIVEKHIERQVGDLQKAAAGIDRKVLQKEIEAALNEREKQQTSMLKEELERMEKEKSGEGEE